tara:strand:- start:1078 stop:1695 length:618 start_codon:yes stop_codon:yes gene_type:complete
LKKIKNIILKEGFRSVTSSGIKSFTVESLASKLAMSKKTIYEYFPKKEILIKKIIEYRMKGLIGEFEEILDEETDAISQLSKIKEHNIKLVNKISLQKLIYLKLRYPKIWEIIEKYRLDRKNIYHRIFTLAKKQGYLKENLDPLVCATLYMNIFNSIFQPDFMNDNNLSIKQTIEHFQYMLCGFLNDKGVKKIQSDIDKYLRDRG